MSRHEWVLGGADASVPRLPSTDASQAAVVAFEAGPALVLGAPGTGKTTTLLAAALARIDAGADPSSVLMFASSRDAASAMREQLTLLRPDGAAPRVATFHGFALDLVARLMPDGTALRVLSGAEQERAVREIIDGTLEASSMHWPAALREAVPTRAFAKEVRAAFAAARSLGLAGDEIARMGRGASDEAWAAIGPVLDTYLEAQDQQWALDYAELMFRAVAALHDDRNARLLEGLRFVYVDEFEESDAMQLEVLVELSRQVQCVVVAADPDSSIFAFRGAEPANIEAFHRKLMPMAVARGLTAPAVLPLGTNHRSGRVARAFAVDVFDRVAVPSLTQLQLDTEALRAPACVGPDTSVRAFLYEDMSSEAAHVVSAIRAQLEASEDAPDAFAVIARSATTLAVVQRALARAGIPASLDVRTGRLSEQPAVRTLLRALEAVAAPEPHLEPSHAHELLLSPLCGLDPSDVRGIARVLRPDRRTPSEGALAAALVAELPAFELDEQLPGARAFEALRVLLRRVHARVRAGATPHEALWLLWSGTPWPERLRRQALEQASTSANRDLDAVCELFDIADRSVQRRQGRAGVSAFVYELMAQDVPSDTLAARGYAGPAVQLLTAHAAKGREWRHVFVVGINEGEWPNLRRRASLLEVDRLTPRGLEAPRTRQALYDEERRLFHVACTRAACTLTVSGAMGAGGFSVQPSRFMANRVVPPVPVLGRPASLDAPDDLIAQLRRTATSTTASDALRAAAVTRLQAMAQLTDANGDALFPEADARRWWGMRPLTDNVVPVHAAGDPLYLRGSSLDALSACSLQWFLAQRASAEAVRGTALVFGSAVHALAEGVATGDLPADAAVLAHHLREAWNANGYEANWQSERDFEQGRAALERLVRWHNERHPRHLAAELEFDQVVAVQTPSGHTEQLRMRGSIDRVEVADDGSVELFDFKTGRTAFTKAQVQDSGQLRFYQLAHALGLLSLPEPAADRAAASYVHLRLDASAGDVGRPNVQERAAMPADDPWVTQVLGAGLDLLRSEDFAATTGTQCTYCQMRAVCPARPEGRAETQ